MEIGVVGAGITGLTAAYRLAQAGHRVTVYEAEDVAGGLSSGFRVEGWGWWLDRFYRHIFAGDIEIIRLAEEIGAPLRFSRPLTSLWYDGRPHPFDSPVSVLRFPGLSWFDKVRFGAVTAYLRYLARGWKRLERFTADAWLRRALGERAYRITWQPLLRGKFGEVYREVNMAWFWARIVKRTPRLGYFEGGFQVFIDRLADAIRAGGHAVRLATRVERVTKETEGVAVYAAGEVRHFDRVLLTCSPESLVQVVEGLPGEFVAYVSALRSLGALTLILALSHSVLTDGTYWLNLPHGEFPCMAMVEHTNYQDRAHYGGAHIVYLGDYLPPEDPVMQMDDEALYALYRPALVRVNPAFEDNWVQGRWVCRERYAQPLPTVGHSAHVPPLALPVEGIYWACMHHVYPWDRGTNYAVDLGERVARRIAEDGR